MQTCLDELSDTVDGHGSFRRGFTNRAKLLIGVPDGQSLSHQFTMGISCAAHGRSMIEFESSVLLKRLVTPSTCS
jgi:hypothetical protein